jgi:putative sterol carrier protein
MAETQSPILIELAELRGRLNGSRHARKLMGAFSRTIRIDFDNGDRVTIIFSNSEMSLSQSEAGEEDLLLRLNGHGRFLDVLRGTLDITHTLASGELIVAKGKVTDLILWNRIIVAGLKK